MNAAAVGPIEIVLPVHNEAASIEATLREFHRVATGRGLQVRFLACEDGSTDGTKQILRSLEGDLPLVARCVPGRLGYSRAVVQGLQAATAPVVGVIDGDGQCDPGDLARMAEALRGNDVVFGFRHPRADVRVRKLMSAAFGVPFRLMFRVNRTDPSCPYLLIRREALADALSGSPGILPQGFWWEFSARVHAAGLRVAEVPVRHRPRAAGTTQVYKPARIPRIAVEHLLGLLALRRDIARGLRQQGTGHMEATPAGPPAIVSEPAATGSGLLAVIELAPDPRGGTGLPVARTGAGAIAGRAACAPAAPPDRPTYLPPHNQADEDQSQRDDNEWAECRDPPQVAEQPPDLVPDEQPDYPVPQAAAAQGQVMTRQPGRQGASACIHSATSLPSPAECSIRRASA